MTGAVAVMLGPARQLIRKAAITSRTHQRGRWKFLESFMFEIPTFLSSGRKGSDHRVSYNTLLP
jgi:hypothetical protein